MDIPGIDALIDGPPIVLPDPSVPVRGTGPVASVLNPVLTKNANGTITLSFAGNQAGQGNYIDYYRTTLPNVGDPANPLTRLNAVPVPVGFPVGLDCDPLEIGLALYCVSLRADYRGVLPSGASHLLRLRQSTASPSGAGPSTESIPSTGVLGFSVPNPPLPAPLVFATLPTTRVAGPGKIATFFLSIINAGADPATSVTIALNSSLPLDFFFQETDPATNTPIGPLNPAVDIPPGGIKSFVLALTPTATFAPSDVAFVVTGTNTAPAPTTIGVNTELLSSFTAPTPDIVALEATSPNDGIFRIRAGDNAAFAVAAVNIGASGMITVGTNTGTVNLPLQIILCRTNPVLGNCISPVGPTVQTEINTNETPTFSIFVAAAAFIPFFPEQNRIFITFTDQNQTSVGGTSVAVETVP